MAPPQPVVYTLRVRPNDPANKDIDEVSGKLELTGFDTKLQPTDEFYKTLGLAMQLHYSAYVIVDGKKVHTGGTFNSAMRLAPTRGCSDAHGPQLSTLQALRHSRRHRHHAVLPRISSHVEHALGSTSSTSAQPGHMPGAQLAQLARRGVRLSAPTSRGPTSGFRPTPAEQTRERSGYTIEDRSSNKCFRVWMHLNRHRTNMGGINHSLDPPVQGNGTYGNTKKRTPTL